MGAKWQRVKINIDENIPSSERLALAEDIISHIVDRTLRGKDKDNQRFVGYSKNYFKKGNVNLYLEGDMLGDLQLLSHKKGQLLIGYQNGTTSNAKADGHISGWVRREIDGEPRDFLGLTESQLKKLESEYT